MIDPKGDNPGDRIRQRILFMRHPETVANTERFFSGRMDVALTPAGVAQRERAVEALVAFSPERIFTSPLSRAHDMAQMAAERLGVECVDLEDLIEIDFGPMENVNTTKARELGFKFPWPIVDGVSQPPEGAESFEQVRDRARAVVDTLLPLDGRTACITHGGFLRMLTAVAYDIPLDRFWDFSIFNVSSLFYTCDGTRISLAGFNMSPEDIIEHCTKPNPYDTRNVWGFGRKDLA